MWIAPPARRQPPKRATPAQPDCFVPQPLLADGTPMWHECLKADYKSKQLFVPYSEQLFTDPETAVLYLHNYLRELSL